MISHANGSAEWHREQLGIKTPEQQRIEQLEAELVSLALEKQMRQMAEQSNVKLLAELAECKRDSWRSYKASIILANGGGMRKSLNPMEPIDRITGALECLRGEYDSAIAAQGEGK